MAQGFQAFTQDELRTIVLGVAADTIPIPGSLTVGGSVAATTSVTATTTVRGTTGQQLGAAPAAAASANRIIKAVTALSDNTAKDVFTVTVPNAAHSAMIRFTVIGSLGAGGAVGANEATHTISYDVGIARTAGVATVATASSAYGSGNSAVSGAATITTVGAVSSMSGGNTATQTFTLTAKVTKGSGSSDNHTVLCIAELVNANASGITIA